MEEERLKEKKNEAKKKKNPRDWKGNRGRSVNRPVLIKNVLIKVIIIEWNNGWMIKGE